MLRRSGAILQTLRVRLLAGAAFSFLLVSQADAEPQTTTGQSAPPTQERTPSAFPPAQAQQPTEPAPAAAGTTNQTELPAIVVSASRQKPKPKPKPGAQPAAQPADAPTAAQAALNAKMNAFDQAR